MNKYPKEILVYPQNVETSTLTSQIQNMNLYEPSKCIAPVEYKSQGQTSRTELILSREPHNVESSISDWEQTSTAPKMKQLFYITLTLMMLILPVANGDIPFPKYPSYAKIENMGYSGTFLNFLDVLNKIQICQKVLHLKEGEYILLIT